MPGKAADSFGAAVAAHLTRVCRRSCGAPADGLEAVLRWVSDCARAQPTSLRLPLLTCEATGGDTIHTIPVAAAWHLLHCAAHLLDDVADESCLSLEPAQAVNAAVTLIFLAQVSLTTLRQSHVEPERVVALVAAFNTATARMALSVPRENRQEPLQPPIVQSVFNRAPSIPSSAHVQKPALAAHQTSSMPQRDDTGDQGRCTTARRTAAPWRPQ